MAPDRNEMARLHEAFLAELNGGRDSRGSGQTWQDQADGRNNRITTEFAFAWDGKSTLGKEIAVSRQVIAKIREQAGGERPQIGLRWYATEDLRRVDEDWIAIPAADYAELLAAARRISWQYGEAVAELQAALDAERARHAAPVPGPSGWFPDPQPGPVPVPALRGPYPPGLPLPPHELWPCLVVDARHDQETHLGMDSDGYWIADDGTDTNYGVSTVRYDRGMGELRLYVNDIRVARGQLYVDGELKAQVSGAYGFIS